MVENCPQGSAPVQLASMVGAHMLQRYYSMFIERRLTLHVSGIRETLLLHARHNVSIVLWTHCERL